MKCAGMQPSGMIPFYVAHRLIWIRGAPNALLGTRSKVHPRAVHCLPGPTPLVPVLLEYAYDPRTWNPCAKKHKAAPKSFISLRIKITCRMGSKWPLSRLAGFSILSSYWMTPRATGLPSTPSSATPPMSGSPTSGPAVCALRCRVHSARHYFITGRGNDGEAHG